MMEILETKKTNKEIEIPIKVRVTVKKQGKNGTCGYIYLPKSWIGRIVVVEVIE